MTEDQANTKWCFMSRFTKLGGMDVSNQPIALKSPDGNCIASHCMAWRWDDDKAKLGGYCGLAETLLRVRAD
jgi:hypothetical protein